MVPLDGKDAFHETTGARGELGLAGTSIVAPRRAYAERSGSEAWPAPLAAAAAPAAAARSVELCVPTRSCTDTQPTGVEPSGTVVNDGVGGRRGARGRPSRIEAARSDALGGGGLCDDAQANGGSTCGEGWGEG